MYVCSYVRVFKRMCINNSCSGTVSLRKATYVFRTALNGFGYLDRRVIVAALLMFGPFIELHILQRLCVFTDDRISSGLGMCLYLFYSVHAYVIADDKYL